MSDSNAHAVQPQAEHEADTAPRRRSGEQRCRFCARENVGDVVDAGGTVGRVHRACFIEWDRKEEALEMSMTVALSLPDPREDSIERELASVTVPQAA
jgi:hypothetical protein